MIELFFELGSEIILVKIAGKKVTFGNTAFGAQMADISGLKLSYDGVCKEHPDLAEENDWREIACERFKNKINEMNSESDISKYVIEELESQGYRATKMQREGFRPVDLK